MRRKKIIAVSLLWCVFLFANQGAAAHYRSFQTSLIFPADKFLRTELYFGMNKPDGEKVSEDDWDKFLETEVTPRFSDGFTVFESYGQYKDSSGKIVREPSRVLVLFYPKKGREAVNQKIEEIRAAYKRQFFQESVLRLDFTKQVLVSF